MTDAIPPWVRQAAQALYDQMERIDGEAMSQGQIDQDPESERFTWTDEVAKVIANREVWTGAPIEVPSGRAALKSLLIETARALCKRSNNAAGWWNDQPVYELVKRIKAATGERFGD